MCARACVGKLGRSPYYVWPTRYAHYAQSAAFQDNK